MHHQLLKLTPLILFLSYFEISIPAAAASSPSSTSSAPVSTHIIAVGKNHQFQPNLTNAGVGDIVEFRFYPSNHSVVRADYLDPCVPYELYDSKKTGFFSGFQPVETEIREDRRPTWSVRINDTDPIFFYCSAPDSCKVWQMIGVINPNSSVSLEEQKRRANETHFALSPGENPPPEATTRSIATPTASVPSAPTMSYVVVAHSSHHEKLSNGVIAAIAVGSIAIVALVAALCFFLGRSRKHENNPPQNSTLPNPAPQDIAPPPHYPPPMSPTNGSTYTNSWYGPTAYSSMANTSPYHVQEQWNGAGQKIHQSPYAELRSATASPVLDESNPYGISEAVAHPDPPRELEAPDARGGNR